MSNIKKSLFRKRRKKESRLKYVMFLSHLWLGLLSGVVIMLLCISGCLYSFKTQIIESYNSDKVFVEAKGKEPLTPKKLQELLETKDYKLNSIYLPKETNRSWSLSYFDAQENLRSTYFDPYSQKELGTSDAALDSFFQVVLDFHRTLLLGDFGRQILGVGVLMFLFLMLSGFILWLPKKFKHLKQSFTIKFNAKFQRVNYDFHKVVGFYSMLLLAFISVTGIYITYPWVKSGLIVVLGGEPLSQINSENESQDSGAFADLMKDMLKRQDEKKQAPEEKMATLEEIVTKVQKEFPAKASLTIEFPNAENPRFMVKRRHNENRLRFIVEDELSFDRSGKLQTKEIFHDKPLNKQFTALAKPLHTGEIMGLSSIIVYFIVTLIGALLPLSGFLIWWNRARKLK